MRRLTTSEASEIDLNISGDGRRISFVRDQNLFAVSIADGREAQITTDGKGPVTCGTAEFVAQEEFGRSTGAWWARSEDHTSELQSLMRISYAVFCLKKKNIQKHN